MRNFENQRGFRPGQTQTEMYKHRRQLEAGNFRSAELSCAFVFVYADCWFSAQILLIGFNNFRTAPGSSVHFCPACVL